MKRLPTTPQNKTDKVSNVVVVDIEVYSTTGGQSSMATPADAVAKLSAKPTAHHATSGKKIVSIVCEKGAMGHPLTAEQKESNRLKSKDCYRVEHVFGFQEQTMRGLVFRGGGLVRAKANIALTNLVYNMCRLVQIKRYQLSLIKVKHVDNQYSPPPQKCCK